MRPTCHRLNPSTYTGSGRFARNAVIQKAAAELPKAWAASSAVRFHRRLRDRPALVRNQVAAGYSAAPGLCSFSQPRNGTSSSVGE
ncbi:hypothetical protein GCM10027569_31660 [Flindersiella endophytica]